MTTRLFSVSLINPVFFDGQSRKQILATYGNTLELTESGYVKAIPPPSRNKPTKVIPLGNVSDFEEIDEAMELAKQLAEEERIRAAATIPAAKGTSKKSGTEKYVKNPKTGQIESVMV